MGQVDAEALRAVAQQVRQPFRGALEHGVGGRLRGQPDEHALQPPGADHPLSDGEGEFRLPRPRRCFDDHEVGVGLLGQPHRCDLGVGGGDRRPPAEAVAVVRLGGSACRGGHRHRAGHVGEPPPALDALPLLVRGEFPLPSGLGAQGEVVLVRGDPVGDDDCRGVGRGDRDR